MSNPNDEAQQRRRLDPGETRIVNVGGEQPAEPPRRRADPYQPIEEQRSGYIPRVPRPGERPEIAEDQNTMPVPRTYPRRQSDGVEGQPQAPYAPRQYQPAQPEPQQPAQRYVEPAPPPSWSQPVPRRGSAAAASAEQQKIQPVGTAKRRNLVGPIFGVLLGLLVLGLLGLFAFAGWYEQQYAGRIYPGVMVLGRDIGGMNSAEAQTAIEEQVASFMAAPITLAWQDKQWNPQPEQLGLRINVESTVTKAFAVGRDEGLFENWITRYELSNLARVVPLSASIDERSVQAYLQSDVAPQIDLPMVQGEVWLQGEQINKTNSQIGFKLDSYAALTSISQGLATLSSNRIELPVATINPAVAQAELDETERLLGTMLSGPLVARYGDKQFAIERLDLSQDVIVLRRNLDPNAEKHYTVEFQDENLKEIVERWADEINIGPQSARFDWNGGNLRVIRESSDGVTVDQEKSIVAIKEALNTVGRRTVDLTVSTTPPSVSSADIDKLGIKQLIATGTSSFAGSSEARATNITVAANWLHGAVIPPDVEFSFLDTLGPITLDRGFVEGYVIAAERTTTGVGGGVCQVSTTAFRAAFWSGLDITVRAPHAYRVAWYETNGEPVGFDAAVFDPGVDFKFWNDTGGYLLIQTWIDNGQLNVGLFGTPRADEVKLAEATVSNRTAPPPDVYQIDPTLPPGTTRQVETARQGLDTAIKRQIIKDGQVIHEETFNSHYEAWPNWYMVASDVQTPTPPLPPEDAAASGN